MQSISALDESMRVHLVRFAVTHSPYHVVHTHIKMSHRRLSYKWLVSPSRLACHLHGIHCVNLVANKHRERLMNLPKTKTKNTIRHASNETRLGIPH